MSTWLDLNDEKEVFRCPYCRKYVSSNDKTCPKCSFQFTDEIKQSSINVEKEEVKAVSRNYYKASIYVGIIFMVIGLLPAVLVIFRVGWDNNLLEPFAEFLPYIVVGLIAIFYGWRGLYKNR